ncbi:MAG TPA: hypothetical protein ENK19_07005 [Acidobacteria bacterium]|nr:hypothetical protein [Acidobacteriota bacterium]
MALLATLNGFGGSSNTAQTNENASVLPNTMSTCTMTDTTTGNAGTVNAITALNLATGPGPTIRRPSGRALPCSLPDLADDVAWFLGQHQDLKKDYFVGRFGVDNHPSGWDTGAYLRAYIDMYEASHDVRILRDLDELLTIVADGNDILTGRIDDRTGTVLPGWGTREYDYGPHGGERYSDMLTNALYAYPLAAFARIVNEDPRLTQEFGADAERYSRMVCDLYAAHEPFVDDEDSPYSDGTTGMYFAYPDNFFADGKDYSGIEAPINWTVIIAEPLVELYRSSIAEGKPNDTYRDIVMKVGNYIWWNMSLNTTDNDDTYLTWYYWPADIDPDGSTRMEDLTHGARLAEFVVSLADAGLRNQWKKKRMQYLANTFTCGAVINETTFANYIDGTGGVYGDDAATLYEWLELQEYSHASSRNTIAFYIENAMRNEGEDEKYNIAVFAKFVRFVTAAGACRPHPVARER